MSRSSLRGAGKRIKALLDAPDAAGWTATMRRSGHWELRSPSGDIQIWSATPSKRSCLRTDLARFRAGIRRANKRDKPHPDNTKEVKDE
jgi:hypothetical protein